MAPLDTPRPFPLPVPCRIVTVDQGNTAVKLTVWHVSAEGQTSVEGRHVYDSADTDALYALIETTLPTGGIYCSVGHMDVRLVESLRCMLEDRFLVLTHHTPLPIGVDYATPATLGMDRVAVAAGAAILHPGLRCEVADAGTALTCDLIGDDKTFKGGRISPGLRLRFEALHAHTSRLPLESAVAEPPVIGTDTPTSILAGVMRGTAAEIALAALADHADRLILTGGDSETLLPSAIQACEAVGAPLPDHFPDLMALGLLSIYLYNQANIPD